MNRTGLWITLGIAAVVGLVFGIWPDLDLKLAALFYEPPPRGFWRSYDQFYLRLRDAVTWIIALVALPAFLALAFKLVRPVHETEHVTEAHSLREAIKTIIMADVVMSLDNILAVGGAARPAFPAYEGIAG